MATQKLEAMAAKGEKLVAKIVGTKPTPKLAPFDLVDFSDVYAYEVKTVSRLDLNGSNKIRISDGAWTRKQAFLDEYDLVGILVVVVIGGPKDIEVYSLPLDRQHIRISRAIRLGDKLN